MRIREANAQDIDRVAELIAKFRVELKAFKGIEAQENVAAAREEFLEYLSAGFPVYLYMQDDVRAAYLVCRVEKPIVWVESLFVLADYRRKGIAGQLYERAEKLAASYGEDTLYNYVHPNNENMIRFLSKRGYSVLNLIELRRTHKNEVIQSEIQVGNHMFQY